MAAPILLPAAFVRFSTERLLFAIAEGFDAIPTDSSLNKRILHRVSAIGSERKIVFGRTTLVAVSLDGEANVGMLLEELRVRLNGKDLGPIGPMGKVRDVEFKAGTYKVSTPDAE